MKITYTGRHEAFSPKQLEKLETKLRKIAKFLDRKEGEKEAHVILSQERFLHKVEITINAYDHALIGIGSNGDLLTAMTAAIDKLEKQVVKMRTKWRDTHRHVVEKVEAVTAAAPSNSKPAKSKAAK